MNFQQIMQNPLQKLLSFQAKLTNTISSGERGQCGEDSVRASKDSTGNDEKLQSHHCRTRDTKSRPSDERTVCNGGSGKKESTEKRNSDDCVFKLDSFKTIECQW